MQFRWRSLYLGGSTTSLSSISKGRTPWPIPWLDAIFLPDFPNRALVSEKDFVVSHFTLLYHTKLSLTTDCFEQLSVILALNLTADNWCDSKRCLWKSISCWLKTATRNYFCNEGLYLISNQPKVVVRLIRAKERDIVCKYKGQKHFGSSTVILKVQKKAEVISKDAVQQVKDEVAIHVGCSTIDQSDL